MDNYKLTIRLSSGEDLTYTAASQQQAFDLYDLVSEQLPTKPMGYMVVENKAVLN